MTFVLDTVKVFCKLVFLSLASRICVAWPEQCCIGADSPPLRPGLLNTLPWLIIRLVGSRFPRAAACIFWTVFPGLGSLLTTRPDPDQYSGPLEISLLISRSLITPLPSGPSSRGLTGAYHGLGTPEQEAEQWEPSTSQVLCSVAQSPVLCVLFLLFQQKC